MVSVHVSLLRQAPDLALDIAFDIVLPSRSRHGSSFCNCFAIDVAFDIDLPSRLFFRVGVFDAYPPLVVLNEGRIIALVRHRTHANCYKTTDMRDRKTACIHMRLCCKYII